MRIVILLDKSGSMNDNKEQTIQGYNDFLENQKKLETADSCSVSLYTFSDSLDTVYENVLLNNADRLTALNYNPDGCTALLDSMGKILKKLEPNGARTLFLIITDGDENSSRKYTHTMIKEMIEGKKEYLETVYIGSNQDAILAGDRVGSQVAINYNDNHTGQVYRNLSAAVTRVRNGNTPSIQFTQEEVNSLVE